MRAHSFHADEEPVSRVAVTCSLQNKAWDYAESVHAMGRLQLRVKRLLACEKWQESDKPHVRENSSKRKFWIVFYGMVTPKEWNDYRYKWKDHRNPERV